MRQDWNITKPLVIAAFFGGLVMLVQCGSGDDSKGKKTNGSPSLQSKLIPDAWQPDKDWADSAFTIEDL